MCNSLQELISYASRMRKEDIEDVKNRPEDIFWLENGEVESEDFYIWSSLSKIGREVSRIPR